MKILNLKTNNIFNLPKDEAKKLLDEYPEDFVKSNGKLKQKTSKTLPSHNVCNFEDNSILSQIIE